MNNLVRIFYLILGIITAAVIPLSALNVLDSYRDWQSAQERLKIFKDYQASQTNYHAKVKAYVSYTDAVEDFVTEAKASNLTKGDWASYSVDISNTIVDIDDIRTYLGSARHSLPERGSGYYFKPERVRILSLRSQEHVDDAQKMLEEDENVELDLNGTVTPGSNVIFTLKGTYLVLHNR